MVGTVGRLILRASGRQLGRRMAAHVGRRDAVLGARVDRNSSRSPVSWRPVGTYWYGSMPAACTRPSQMYRYRSLLLLRRRGQRGQLDGDAAEQDERDRGPPGHRAQPARRRRRRRARRPPAAAAGGSGPGPGRAAPAAASGRTRRPGPRAMPSATRSHLSAAGLRHGEHSAAPFGIYLAADRSEPPVSRPSTARPGPARRHRPLRDLVRCRRTPRGTRRWPNRRGRAGPAPGGAAARRLQLHQGVALRREQFGHPPQQCGRVTADPDVPVRQQHRHPPPGSRHPAEHVPQYDQRT